MHIPSETPGKQKIADGNHKPVLPVKWLALLTGILIIFSIGLFANYHHTLSASSLATPEPILVPHNEGGQSQRNEIKPISTDKLATTPSIWPTDGAITSAFGWRSAPLGGGGNELHQGVDIANYMSTPVVATADGEVVQSGWSGGYGNTVQIDHGNGIATIYGHNSQIVVNVGQSIKKGQVISYVGSTGKSTGPHLHYEIRVNGVAVDPMKFMVL